MTTKAKQILIPVGAILIVLFPISRWIAREHLRNAPREFFSAVTVEIKETSRASVLQELDVVAKQARNAVEIKQQKDTTLWEIGVYDTDANRAAEKANAIAVACRDNRIEALRKNTDQTLAETKKELKAKEEELGRLFQEASKIRQEDNIVDPDPESANAALSIAAPSDVVGGEAQVAEKRALVNQLRNQITRVEQLRPDELIEAIHIIGITDQTIEKTVPLLKDADARKAKLVSESLDENDPRMKRLRAEREVYAKLLSDQIGSIKRSLNTKLGIEEAALKTFEEQITSAGKPPGDEKVRMNRYVEKKAAYLTSKQLLLSIRQRYDSARFDNMLSQVPVKIWQKAVPALYPARPDVASTLRYANVIGGSLGGIGILLILIATCIKSSDVNTNAPMNPSSLIALNMPSFLASLGICGGFFMPWITLGGEIGITGSTLAKLGEEGQASWLILILAAVAAITHIAKPVRFLNILAGVAPFGLLAYFANKMGQKLIENLGIGAWLILGCGLVLVFAPVKSASTN